MPETNLLYCRPDGIISREVDSGTVMLNLPTASYYGLGESGTMLWNALASPSGTRDLAALLRSEFQITQDTAVHDVNAFVEGLLAEGLLEVREALPASGAATPADDRVVSITAGSALIYSPPVLERGLLRNAAHNVMGTHPDGGHTPAGTTQYS